MIHTEYPHGEDFPIICINTPHCSAKISLYGGHIIEWAPKGQKPVFYMSPQCVFKQGTPLRGGVPICWPWFGKGPEGQPSHGVARTALWKMTSSEVEENGLVRIIIALETEDEMLPSAAQIFEFSNELLMSLITLEVPHQMPFSAAQHTYFAVSDYEQVAITGLEEAPFVEYAEDATPHCEDPLIPAGRIDRIYHPIAEEQEITLHDPAWNRSIKLLRRGSHSAVVWNPGASLAASMSDIGAGNERGFLCLETTAVPAENLSLPYGSAHELTTRIQIIPID